MAQWSVNQYINILYDSLQQYDGEKAADLLSFNHPHVANVKLQIQNPEKVVRRVFEQPWEEVVTAHLRCCTAVGRHDFIEAFDCQSTLVQAFTKIFQSQKDENWSLPILFAICLDLRLFAHSADQQAVKLKKGKFGERLENAAEALMGCFRVCASDNRAAIEDTKKWGMLNIVNQLFKIYFRINKLHLCKPLIRAIDSLPMKDKFSLSHLITFRYYVGQKAMFDGDFKKADEYLSFAFERCHRASRKNKRLILQFLVPVKMLLGQMPKKTLLRKYDLLAFEEVSSSVCAGDIRRLTAVMDKHEHYFIKCGIYLILEKLKIIAYRNLFKKVYVIKNTHQLPISSFTAALRWMEVDEVDDDETACIIANLICDNRIKGYISYQHKKLVVSKQNPFPQLSASAS